jgi:hypothetical protein
MEAETVIEPWRPGPLPRAAASRRGRWLRAGAALALFVGGGFTWQALSGRLAGRPEPGTVTARQEAGATTAAAPATVAMATQAAAPVPAAAPTATPPATAAPAAAPVAAPPATPAPAAALVPVAVAAVDSPPAAQAAMDPAHLAAAAEAALTQAPPAAGHVAPAGVVPPAPDAGATLAPPLRVAEVARATSTGERTRHRARSRPGEERVAAPPVAVEAGPAALASPAALAGPCTGTAETLSLCGRRAPGDAELAPARGTAPAPVPARAGEGRTAPPGACDQTRAVLGLCGGP